MFRPAALAIAALTALLLTGCGGAFGQNGISLPAAGDDVQTVSDAVDSLDAHRGSATDYAKAAIGVADAFGSVVRTVSDDEALLASASLRDGLARKSGALVRPHSGVYSVSQLVMQPSVDNVSAFCDSSAGYSLRGIPSLDETFGWRSGAYAGGTRTNEVRDYATWSVNATGETLQAPIGSLSLIRTGSASCPMMTPTFEVKGARTSNAFSLPMTLTYRRGKLVDLNLTNAVFAGGERLNVATSGRGLSVNGVVTRGSLELASFRLNAAGQGKLTITSSGAQYAITDWIVAGV